MAAGAAHADGQLLLALGDVPRHDDVQKVVPLLLELDGLLAHAHEVAHRGVQPRQRPQFRIVIGVRQEAHVHDEIRIVGGAVLEAEGVHGDRKPLALAARGEEPPDGAAQLLGQHIGGVDDVVGAVAKAHEHEPLALDALPDGGAVGAQRMPAAARLVTGDELVVGGIEEQRLVGDAGLSHGGKLGLQIAEEVAVARVADHGQTTPAALVLGTLVHAHELGEQARRQVVHAVVVQILEDVHGFRAPGAGHARHDDEVGHLSLFHYLLGHKGLLS